MDVVFYEAFKEEQGAIKKYLGPKIRAAFRSTTIQESGDKNPPSRLISIRTQSRIPKRWKGVKAVLTRSQGYDHLLEWQAKADSANRAGYLGNYCARAVAEQAVFLMLMLMRQCKKQVRQFDSFDRNGLTGVECKSRNACIVGVGSIGKEIADILKGLKMNVCGVDKVKRLKMLEYVTLISGIRRADALFCALPLTKETRGLLDYRALSHSKKGLILVNIARAEITPVKGLRRLMKEGRIKALALDVFEDEPELAVYLRRKTGRLGRNNRIILEMRGNDNVVLTPHNAFNTEEALNEKAKQTVRAVKSYLRCGRFPTQIPAA